MKKRNLLILAGVLLLVLLIELYATGAFSSLQGRLSVTPGSLNRGPVYSLAASSPSGSRSVSTSDTVFGFDVSGKLTIPQGTIFEFEFDAGDGDINSYAEGEAVFLYHEGDLIGEGTVDVNMECFYSNYYDEESGSYVSDSGCYGAFTEISTNERISLFSGVESLELQIDTDALLADDPAEDDPLDITMTVGSQTVVGNTLNY